MSLFCGDCTVTLTCSRPFSRSKDCTHLFAEEKATHTSSNIQHQSCGSSVLQKWRQHAPTSAVTGCLLAVTWLSQSSPQNTVGPKATMRKQNSIVNLGNEYLERLRATKHFPSIFANTLTGWQGIQIDTIQKSQVLFQGCSAHHPYRCALNLGQLQKGVHRCNIEESRIWCLSWQSTSKTRKNSGKKETVWSMAVILFSFCLGHPNPPLTLVWDLFPILPIKAARQC